MTVFLDDQTVDLAGSHLAEVLDAAQKQLASAGRMVVEIQIDGQTLASDQLEQQANTPLADGAELRLYSAEPATVACQALEGVRQQLLDQQQILADAAEQLQQDQASEAFQSISQVNDVWITTIQALEQAAALIRFDLNSLTVNDKPFSAHTADLLATLQQLKQQVEDQDTVGLADAFTYEWPNTIQQWDAVIGSLIEQTSA